MSIGASVTADSCFDIVHYHPSNDWISSDLSREKHFLYQYLRFKQYFRDHRYVAPKSISVSAVDEKHNLYAVPEDDMRLTFYNGGVAYVPKSELSTVLDLYAKDIVCNTPMYMNQLAYDDCCRIFVDVDSTIVLYEHQLLCLCKQFIQTLREYFQIEDGSFPLIGLAYSGPKLKKNSEISALHIHCHVMVTLSQLAQFTYGFSMRVQSKHPDLFKHIDIDPSVMKSSYANLRMIYSRKVETCMICKNSEMKNCDLCNGTAKVSTKKNYIPKTLVSSEGKFDRTRFRDTYSKGTVLQNMKQLVSDFSIWWLGDEKEKYIYCKPTGDPEYEFFNSSKRESKNKNKNVSRNSRKRKRTQNECVDAPTLKAVQTSLRSIVIDGKQPWENITVQRIDMNAHWFNVVVGGLNSKYCMYKKCDHSSNHIFFQIRKDTRNVFGFGKPVIVQMCYNDECKGKVQFSLSNRLHRRHDPESVLYFWKCDVNIFQELNEQKNLRGNKRQKYTQSSDTNDSNARGADDSGITGNDVESKNLPNSERIQTQQRKEKLRRKKQKRKKKTIRNLKRIVEEPGFFTMEDVRNQLNKSVKAYIGNNTTQRRGRRKTNRRQNKSNDPQTSEEQPKKRYNFQ